jgi:lysophospholipase L1-like esterase
MTAGLGWATRTARPEGTPGTFGGVTAARDELRPLVEQLPDEQIPAALAEVQRVAASGESAEWPPPWFGAVTSKRSDTSERVDEPLADGFDR